MTPFSWEHMSTLFVGACGAVFVMEATVEPSLLWAVFGGVEGILMIALALHCALHGAPWPGDEA